MLGALCLYTCSYVGVHLRSIQGDWKLVDGSEFHTEFELNTSLESMREWASPAKGDSIASKVVREKQVTLPNGVCCHWIPKQHGHRGKWRVLKCAEQSVVTKQLDEYEQELIPRPISSPVNCGKTEEAISRVGDVPREEQTLVSTINQFTGKVSSKVKGAFSNVPSLPGSKTASRRSSSPKPTHAYMSLELITIREQLLVPLNRSINLIRQHFTAATSHRHLKELADDTSTSQIGYLIRRQFCSAFSALLSLGLKTNNALPHFLFGKPTQYNTWTLVKDVAQSCKNEPILMEMVKIIQNSPFLFDDSLRFRCFVSDMLNYPSEDGDEKLLMTWYRKFLSSNSVLER